MKTATITLRVTPEVPMPQSTEPKFSAFAGFRLTLTAPSGAKGGPPAENKLVWTFGGMFEGQVYKLLVEAVDDAGHVIQSLAEATLQVPAAATYTRVDGFEIAWT
jgi:hypothetical protein